MNSYAYYKEIEHDISFGETATKGLSIIGVVKETVLYNKDGTLYDNKVRVDLYCYLTNTTDNDIEITINETGEYQKAGCYIDTYIVDTYNTCASITSITGKTLDLKNMTIKPGQKVLLNSSDLQTGSIAHTYDSDGTRFSIFGITLKMKSNIDLESYTNLNCGFKKELILSRGELPQDEYYTELSDGDKQLLASDSSVLRTKLIVISSNYTSYNYVYNITDLGLTEQDSVKSWKYNEERYVPNNGVIGQFVARELSGELQNISDDFNIEDCDVKLLLGIIQPNSRFNRLSTEDGNTITDEQSNELVTSENKQDITTWYQLGNFLITKPTDDEVKDNTKYEAMDYTVLFNATFKADYISNNFTKSFETLLKETGYVSLLWLARYTCDQVGVEFATEEFTNSTFKVTSNQFTGGESCRDVMKAISQLAFGWCRIGWDNKCYIDEFNVSTIETQSNEEPTLNYDNYYSLTTQKSVYGPVNKIVIGMKDIDGENTYIQDTYSIERNGLCELDIWDNPFLYTQELRESVIDSANRLFGLTYRPMTTETIGHPWIPANELISVSDMENNVFTTYALNKEINYSGHIRTPFSTTADTQTQVATTYDKSLYQNIRDVRISVNKHDGIITLLNSNVTALNDGLSKLENRVETTYTDSYSKTEIQEIISGTNPDGTAVSSVTTTSGTFDKNGLTIEQTSTDPDKNSNTKTNINSNGMVIYDKNSSVDDPLLTVNSNGVVAKNITLSTYLTIGNHSRVEDYTHTDGREGTGVFWIGG